MDLSDSNEYFQNLDKLKPCSNFRVTGIYKITNTINGDFYIGSSKEIYKRLYQHKFDILKGTHRNKYLTRAISKYGIENFIVQVIEICEEDKLLEKEQYWMDNLNPKYNLFKIAGSPIGYKHSDEVKERLSEKRKIYFSNPNNRENMRVKLTGRKFSEETLLKMSLRKKETGYRPCDEANQKQREAVCKPVVQYTTDGKELQQFDSIISASKKTGVHGQGIGGVLRGRLKTSGGYKWGHETSVTNAVYWFGEDGEWRVTQRTNYHELFSGGENVIRSSSIETLVALINKFDGDIKKIKKNVR